MGLAIDGEGYFINAQGQRLDQSQQGNHAAWKQAIEDTRTKAETNGADTGDLPPPEEETSYVVVEKGDCLWSIAEEAGVDPAQLSYKDNEQFEANPDLIHPGDIVFVRQAQPTSTTESPGGAKPTLSDIEATAQSGDRAALRSDLSNYIGSAWNSDGTAPAFRAVVNHDWGDSQNMVMQELQNAVISDVNKLTTFIGPPSINSSEPRDSMLRGYVSAYLSALPDVCFDLPRNQRQVRESRLAAQALLEHDWERPDAVKTDIQTVINNLNLA